MIRLPATPRLRSARTSIASPLSLLVLLVLALGVPVLGCASDGNGGGGGGIADAGGAGTGRGAAEPRLVGTWRGQEQNPTTPFQFVAVTFAPDGTYTAGLNIGGQTRADSGRWRTSGEQELMIDPGSRRYRYELRGEETLVLTDPQTNVSASLARVR